MLALGVPVLVSRELPCDDLAGPVDPVGQVGGHEVPAGAAADRVDEPVLRLDAVVAAPGDHAVAPGARVDEVGAGGPADRLRARRPQPLCSTCSRSEDGAGERSEGEEPAHGVSLAAGS